MVGAELIVLNADGQFPFKHYKPLQLLIFTQLRCRFVKNILKSETIVGLINKLRTVAGYFLCTSLIFTQG